MELSADIKKHYALLNVTGQGEPTARELLISLQRMMHATDKLVDSGHTRIVFNLSRCNQVNSSLISLFVRASARVRPLDGWIKIVIPKENTHARQVLELVGLGTIAELYESEQEILRFADPNNTSKGLGATQQQLKEEQK